MSRRLCIGILGITKGWETILDQIGCWYEELDELPKDYTKYSLLIINKVLSDTENPSKELFLSSGGALLSTQRATKPGSGKGKRTRIYNHNTYNFLSHIPFLDIYFEKGNASFSDLLTFEYESSCELSLNPDDLIQDETYTRKRFFFKRGLHPDELASTINKHELTEFILAIIKELHFRQSLPFVCKWTSPKEDPIFAFRIDSDYGNEQAVKELYQIGKQHTIPITWFLHVEAHEEWLSVFKEFEGQEIALHGFEHGTSSSYEHVINNIERGLQKLRDEGFDPKGFCAPYAIWDSTMKEVLKQFHFEYSSEFTIGYDGLPFYPENTSGQLPLQIPLHPICTGSMSRKRISEAEMEQYFSKSLKRKLARHYPVVFYHHPLQSGTSLWNSIFEEVNELGLTKLSFLEYAIFWKKRISTSFEAFFEEASGEVTFRGSSDLIYQQSNDHQAFNLIHIKDSDKVIKTSTKSFAEISHPTIEELKELTSSSFQLLKTSILDWRNRKKL